MDLRGWEIIGLNDLGDTSWDTWNHTTGIENCRAWCYSNLACRYWQYAPGVCMVEDIGRLPPIEYPLTLNAARQGSKFAQETLAGEFISHVCPPQPARAAARSELTAESLEGSWALQWSFDVAACAVLCFAIGKLWFRMRGYESTLPRDTQEPRRCSSRSGFDAADDLGLSGHRLCPAPVTTFLMPGKLDHLLHGVFATRAERKAVRAVTPEAPASYANYLAWRRAFSASLVLLGLVAYVMQLRVLFSTWKHHVYFQDIGRDPDMQTYQAWVRGNPPNPSFIEYSKEKVMTLLAGILGEVLRGAFFVDLTVCTLELLPLIWLTLAVFHWTKFADSQRLIIRAWLGIFLSAFAVSLFPVRFMLDFAETELQADVYVHELAVAMNLDKAQKLLLGSCESLGQDPSDLEHRVKLAGDTLQKTCSNLARFPVQLAVPCVSSLDMCHVDLGQAMDGCKEAVQQIEVGHIDKATEIIEKQCERIRGAFEAAPRESAPRGEMDRSEGRSKAFETLVGMMRIPFRVVVPSVELVSLTVSALHGVLMVLPPVIGIAPGFMAAGFAAKVVAPHACLPGAVIFIVPIVWSTIGWLLNCVLFQYVSHSWVFALLVVVVSYPLGYIVIAWKYRVAMPVHHSTLVYAARTSTILNILFCALVATISYRIFKDFGAHELEMSWLEQLLDWCHVSWGRLGLACASRALFCFALTFFGAADWMLADISAQQRYWHFWAHHGALGAYRPDSKGEGGGADRVAKAGDNPIEDYEMTLPTDVHANAVSKRRLSMTAMLSGSDSGADEERDNSRDACDEDVADLFRHRIACREAAARKKLRHPRPTRPEPGPDSLLRGLAGLMSARGGPEWPCRAVAEWVTVEEAATPASSVASRDSESYA